jgi:hypothetical protein
MGIKKNSLLPDFFFYSWPEEGGDKLVLLIVAVDWNVMAHTMP